MSATGGHDRPRQHAALISVAAAVGVASTVAVVGLPYLQFAYRAPALHVSLETANAIIALLVAFLIYGRYREHRRAQELLLLTALCTVAVANLIFTALPSALTLGRDADISRWGPLAIRFFGTLVLTAAALTPAAARVKSRTAALALTGVAGVVVLLGVGGLLLGPDLPEPVDPTVPLDDASGPLLVAHPLVSGVQVAGLLLYTVAALAFTRQSARTGDELMRWVGAGCVLAAFARVHYLLFPSLYSDFVYTGDLLRLGFYLLMLVGASREIRSYWQARTVAAVLDDRRRMARELHDGLTQELSYIAAQSQRLAARPGDTTTVERIGAAAGRAGDEARRAIDALTRPVDEPFPVALQRLADEMAHRYEVKVLTELEPDARLGADQAEGLLRIVGEAVRNAVRHGAAKRIELRLNAHPLCLAVSDDGRGFPVDAPESRTGGFGLTSMRERAEGMGADFAVTSTPGEGTTVQVTWT